MRGFLVGGGNAPRAHTQVRPYVLRYYGYVMESAPVGAGLCSARQVCAAGTFRGVEDAAPYAKASP